MPRLLPVPVGRPRDLLVVPHEGARLPTKRPGFTMGDPRPWVPGTLAMLEAAGHAALPWGPGCDLLLAPYPAPGEPTAELLDLVRGLPATYPVAFFERDVPLLPNLLLPGPADEIGEPIDAPTGLRAFRAALRRQGRGAAEALTLLPARRVSFLLRSSAFTERLPGPGGSLQNRRWLVHALDHQRSLVVTAPLAAERRALDPVDRVLVVMPHFDDEVLQCGGAILAARAAGMQVRIVWLTDGAAGVPGVAPEESSRIRKEEARAAAAALGVEDVHFLDAPETGLVARRPWTAALRRQLEEFAPTRVHTVWWGDNHVDHYEATRVLRAAWPRALRDTEIAASGLWTPLAGGRAVPLGGERGAARDAALRAHASQLAVVDYARAARGLALWYGDETRQPAERFLCCPAPDWFRRFRESGAHRRWYVQRGNGPGAATGAAAR